MILYFGSDLSFMSVLKECLTIDHVYHRDDLYNKSNYVAGIVDLEHDPSLSLLEFLTIPLAVVYYGLPTLEQTQMILKANSEFVSKRDIFFCKTFKKYIEIK